MGAHASGRVVKVISVANGAADDDPTVGFTLAERHTVASLYLPGQSLWRAAVDHFSPCDINWSAVLPPDARPWLQKILPVLPEDDTNCAQGSLIDCQNQSLGESLALSGTPFTLHYRSDRVPGHFASRTLDIPLTGNAMHPALLRVGVKLEAGRRVAAVTGPPLSPAQPNMRLAVTWDGRDVYNRLAQGRWTQKVEVTYYFAGFFGCQDRFGGWHRPPSLTCPTGTTAVYVRGGEFPLTRSQEVLLQFWDARGLGLGAWTLDVHHVYDPVSKILHLGTGQRRSAEGVGRIMTTIVGGGGLDTTNNDGVPAHQGYIAQLKDLAVGADGTVYFLDRNRVRKVGPDGLLATVAGSVTNAAGYAGDGGPATLALLNAPVSLALGPDNSLYLVDGGVRIRKVDPTGIITTVAGTGVSGFNGDNLPAQQSQLAAPARIAVGADHGVYVADTSNNRRRRIDADGRLTTLVTAPAPVTDVTVNVEGLIYYAVQQVPYQLTATGTSIPLSSPGDMSYMTAAPDGSVYMGQNAQSFFDYSCPCYRRRSATLWRRSPTGHFTHIAGSGAWDTWPCRGTRLGNNIPALEACFSGDLRAAFGPDRQLYVADGDPSCEAWAVCSVSTNRIRKIAPPLPGYTTQEILIPSQDGGELYVFTAEGRHLRTVHGLTGAVVYVFGYDPAGRLISITDGDGQKTVVERDGAGNPTALVGPYGQRTMLMLDADRYLALVTDPAGQTTTLTYVNDGRLATLTDAKQQVHRYFYDSLGRLSKDEDPAGGSQSLTRQMPQGVLVGQPDTFQVTRTTGMGRVTRYDVEHLTDGGKRRVLTPPEGVATSTVLAADCTRQHTRPDGTQIVLSHSGDPRFGLLAPVPRLSITTPSGKSLSVSTERTATLPDPQNLFNLRQTDVIKVNGRSYTQVYDSSNKTITTTTPAGRQITAVIDPQGRVTQSQIGGLEPVQFTYDSHGRLSTAVQGTGAQERLLQFTYNTDGYVDTITDPLNRMASLQYDAVGRVTTQTLLDGRTIGYHYDANGNLTSITPPGRPVHEFSHTPVDLVSAYTPPDVGVGTNVTTYAYDLDRDLTTITRSDGQTIHFTYDNGGRLSTVTTPTDQYLSSYDPQGQLSSILMTPSNGTGERLVYTYDGNLPLSTTWTGPISGSVSRTYDHDFRMVSQSVNGGNTVHYAYDNDSLLTGAGSLTLTRNSQNGLLTGTTLGSVMDTWTHNTFAEPTGYIANISGSPSYAYTTTRDLLGRITQKTETIGGTTDVYDYTYDPSGRLTDVQKNGVLMSHYTYDANGNRLTRTASGVTVDGTYDAQDRLLTYGGNTYTYTANGELQAKITAGQTTAYSYDVVGTYAA